MNPPQESALKGHVPISVPFRPLWVQALLPFSPPVIAPNVKGGQSPGTRDPERDVPTEGSGSSGGF
jgi:hypothetical protein